VSWSAAGKYDVAASASKARFCSQFFRLWCRLYFNPFCSNSSSSLESWILVLLMMCG
jgi:hypothetical protein